MTQATLAAGRITAWFGIIRQKQKPRACVPHTPYTTILRFASHAGKVCGMATHAHGWQGFRYGLLLQAIVKRMDFLRHKFTPIR